MNLFKTGEGILFYLGIMLITLIALYGVAHLIIRYAPQPVNGWFSAIIKRSTAGGWGD